MIGTALGMLGQMMGPVLQPVAYLSKQLDEVARGWPTCLRAVAATAFMVKEASKLTLGQPTTVYMAISGCPGNLNCCKSEGSICLGPQF
uniref:Reverse transcriptase RNase H-like domain-containing protein n=1 Tax=Moschus moschiferus TaxID=68415 RepID=A0A8C6CTW8_MOSMO